MAQIVIKTFDKLLTREQLLFFFFIKFQLFPIRYDVRNRHNEQTPFFHYLTCRPFR